jgi:CheY-like chemotaxis protein
MPHRNTILCVDDEKDIVDCLHDTFMQTYNVKTALSGKEALEIFEQEEIALVITDQRMEGMDGVELLARIRGKDPLCKKILLTGYADIHAAVDSINKGSVDRYFNKPWDDEELVKAVEHLLKMHDFDIMMKRALSSRKELVQELESVTGFLDCQDKGICVLGREGEIHYLNRKGLEYLSIDELSSIKGKSCIDLFQLEGDQEKKLHTRSDSRKQAPVKIHLRLGNGGTVDVMATPHFAEDETGNPLLRGIDFQQA